MLIRPVRPEEAALITELGIRSKGYWGYDQAFMEACRADLTITPEFVAGNPVFALEESGSMRGFYGLLLPETGTEVVLDFLYVDPNAIGTGVGKRLYQHAMAQARKLGFRTVSIAADPHAEGFYQAMGAVRVGETESTAIPGRMLPLLRMHLDDAGESVAG